MHLDLFSNLTIVLILQLKCIMNVEQRWYLVCIQCKLLISIFISILEIDECASHPCQNEGTCNNAVNEYLCTCKAGYTDTNCETGLSNSY